MLEYIRNSAQSFGVKVAFAVIILVFVFWGIGNFNDRDYSNVVAVVNGEPIVATEFEKAYRNAEEYLLSTNPGMTREMLVKDHLGRRVLNDLIQEALIAQEAQRAGIQVTPVEMRMAVGQIKAFQDEKGNFNPEAYKRVLAAQRMSLAQYEDSLASRLLREKVFALVAAPVWVDPDEAKNMFNYLGERRIADYIFLPATDFSEKVTVPESEVRAWYDSHQNEFAIPPMVDVQYIEVKPEDLGDPAKIDDAAAKAWYEANKSRFEVKEQVRARHILIPLAESASEEEVRAAQNELERAKKELAGGKSFAEVANEFNKQSSGDGGDLGWISRGQTVPQFEEAAFALAPGEISGEVRTPFGLHLVLVEEKKEAGIAPYETVAAEARKGAAYDEGVEKLHEVLDNLIEDNILQKPLADSAQKYGLKVQQTGLMDKTGLENRMSVKSDAADALLKAASGSPLDTALEAGDKYIVARITASEPASTKPFEQVQDEINARLKQEKALALAMAEGRQLLNKIGSQSLQQVRAQNIEVIESEPLQRGQALTGLSPDEALAAAIFAAKAGTWLPDVYSEKKDDVPGAVLVMADKILPPDDLDFGKIRDVMADGVKRQRMNALFEVFMQNLLNKAKVEVVNPDLVDRVNM